MAGVLELPPELRIAPNNLGDPAVAAAFAPSGVLVAAVQRSFTAALARIDDALGEPRVRVLASAEHATWDLGGAAPLPDGSVLLCTRGPGPNLLADAATLGTAAAGDLVGAVPADASAVSQKDVKPRHAFAIGGRLVVAHGAAYSDTAAWCYFSEVPGAGPPRPWVHDLGGATRAYDGTWWNRWHAHRSAVAGDVLVLAGQTLARSGSYDHALVALDAGGAVRAVVARDRALVRDDGLALTADRGRLLLSATGTLEVLDAALGPVAVAPPGHPFTTAFRLLAGDGAGRLLWYDRKRYLLVLTGPGELAHDALGESLDRLAAAAARVPAAARPATAAPRRATRVPRHTLDTGLFDEFLRGRRRELEALLADPGAAPHPSLLARLGEDVLAHASVFDRDDPIAGQAVRALAQGRTGELVASAARGGVETVDVPFADRVAAVPARNVTSVGPLTWRDAWYAAVIAGETRCLDRLEALGDDAIGAAAGPRHAVAIRHALQAYRAAPASAVPLVEAALAVSTPADFQAPVQWRHHQPQVAVYPLLLPLVARDAAGFDAALLAALKAHRKHFGSKSRSNAVQGWVALGAQAMCCLAHDAGIRTGVESEYLLPALTERRLAPS